MTLLSRDYLTLCRFLAPSIGNFKNFRALNVFFFAVVLTLSWENFLNAEHFQVRSSGEFEEGNRLLDRKNFYHAQKFFDQSLFDSTGSPQDTQVHYYVATCSIKLNRKYGQQQLVDFAKSYPGDMNAKYAEFTLANLAMKRQAFAEAIGYYESIDLRTMDPATQASLRYNLAYSYLSEKIFDQALPIFLDLARQDTRHRYNALYYAGFIEFKNERYDTALKLLQQSCADVKYRFEVPYMLAQIFYRQKQFDDLLNYVSELTRDASTPLGEVKNMADIRLLLAEAHFAKLDYKVAAPLYEAYLVADGRGGEVSPLVNYHLAYSLYMLGEFDRALAFFKRVDFENSMLGQLACYYTGAIYLLQGELNMALAPLSIARDRNFAEDIAEESAFKYAQATFGMCNYDAAIQACLTFKDRYPSSRYKLEVDEILSFAYSHTRRYDTAIAYMEAFVEMPVEVAKNYQKIALARAIELYHASDLHGALVVLNKSLAYQIDKRSTDLARFLRAKIYVQSSAIDRAMLEYSELIRGSSDGELLSRSLYEQGYVSFNKKDYKAAHDSFAKARGLGFLSETKKLDIALRMADCAYATKDYKVALDAYRELESYSPAHCYHHRGLILSHLKESNLAHMAFDTVIKEYRNTILYEKALFENAMLYFSDEDYAGAIDGFSFFIKEKPGSDLQSKAILYRAIALLNLKKYDEAIHDCVALIQSYVDTPYAQHAIVELQRALVALGKAEEFAKYLELYRQKNSNVDALETSAFDVAKSLYYQQQYAPAIESFIAFLKNFSKSKYLVEANYLLAESYHALQRFKEAEAFYYVVVDDATLAFHNKVLLRMATICQKSERHDRALVFFKKLHDSSKTARERSTSLEGIIKCNFKLKQYDDARRSAEIYAKEQKNLNTQSLCEINLMLATIAIEEGRGEDARSLLMTVYRNNSNVHAAEALYILARLLYGEKDYKASLDILFELSRSLPQHKTWRDKAQLLIADNYFAMGELLHATTMLNSILKDSDDKYIIKEANLLLKKVNEELADMQKNSISKKKERLEPLEKQYKEL